MNTCMLKDKNKTKKYPKQKRCINTYHDNFNNQITKKTNEFAKQKRNIHTYHDNFNNQITKKTN